MLSVTPISYASQIKPFLNDAKAVLKLIPEQYETWRQCKREYKKNQCSATNVFNDCAYTLDSNHLFLLYVALLCLCDHDHEADKADSAEKIANKYQKLKTEVENEASQS
ncbi:hypothetical protein HK098_002630 [Nowakowskiella sp. JEL0407]|nr:hypothetical protein HK098_002630 [Nowakowskiella sp. JEL0407]